MFPKDSSVMFEYTVDKTVFKLHSFLRGSCHGELDL